jgi:hypothetical protein
MSSTLSGSSSSLFQLEQIQNETAAPVPEKEQTETEDPEDETPAVDDGAEGPEKDQEDQEEPEDVRNFFSVLIIHSPYMLTVPFCLPCQ